MAKLYFNYSSMNAGKTTVLLQSAHNYRERGMTPLLYTPKLDDRYGEGWIKSRIGLQARATIFKAEDDLFEATRAQLEDRSIHCVLVDEAQFLNRDQVYQLSEVVDRLNIPVLCFGLRTDFQGELFEGSKYLLAWADQLTEIKTICHTGRKANMVVRVDDDGYALKEGAQVQIGGNERYVSVSRAEFKKVFIGGERIKFIEPLVADTDDESNSDSEQDSGGLL
ncbi:MAG: thymidine kinase [Xanthomonadales bacterium]|nr:thymidine kinase [Xanthomonadales bacterium]